MMKSAGLGERQEESLLHTLCCETHCSSNSEGACDGLTQTNWENSYVHKIHGDFPLHTWSCPVGLNDILPLIFKWIIFVPISWFIILSWSRYTSPITKAPMFLTSVPRSLYICMRTPHLPPHSEPLFPWMTQFCWENLQLCPHWPLPQPLSCFFIGSDIKPLWNDHVFVILLLTSIPWQCLLPSALLVSPRRSVWQQWKSQVLK